MKSFRHYHRKWRIWHNKFSISKLVKKITPLMLAVLMSKNLDGQGLPSYDKMNMGQLSYFISDQMSSLVFVDIDNDGVKDAFSHNLVYDRSVSYFFENFGNKEFPNFIYQNPSYKPDSFLVMSNLININGFNSLFLYSDEDSIRTTNRQFFDFDNDGDVDLLTNNFWRIDPYLPFFTMFFRNNGTPNKPYFEETSFMTQVGSFSAKDLNNDGLFDLYDNEYLNDTISVFLNSGDVNMPQFDFLNPARIDIPQSSSNLFSIQFYDYNGDGWDDLIENSIVILNDDGYVGLSSNVFLRNAHEFSFDTNKIALYDAKKINNHSNYLENFNRVEFIDFDHDGDADLYIGGLYDFGGYLGLLDRSIMLENKGFLHHQISGKVFVDINMDGIFDDEECLQKISYPCLNSYGTQDTCVNYVHLFNNLPVRSHPNNILSLVDGKGDFNISLPKGYSKIELPFIKNFTVEPASYVFNFGDDSISQQFDRNFYLTPIPNQHDVSIDLSGLATRPGFDSRHYIDVGNLSVYAEQPKLYYFPGDWMEFLQSTPPPSDIINDTLIWDVDLLPGLSNQQITVDVKVKTDAIIGAYNFSKARIEINDDHDLTNNYIELNQMITGSFDPNDKLVNPIGAIDLPNWNIEQPFTYTIRFQNTGNDTAFTVIIKDTLDENFSYYSFEMISSSHNYEMEIKDYRTLIWRFYEINLPDSSTNLIESQGYIKYKLTPKETVDVGTIITNKADIYFDYNTPVATNETRNIFGVLTGINHHKKNITSKAYPNPTKDKLLIEFDKGNKEDVIITIYDMNGHQLLQKTIRDNFFSFNTYLLASGIYLYTLESVESFGKGKFIKE